MAQEADLTIRVAVVEERQNASHTWEEKHQDECGQRYRSLDNQLIRVHARIDQFGYAIGAAAISGILTLVTVLFQALMHMAAH